MSLWQSTGLGGGIVFFLGLFSLLISLLGPASGPCPLCGKMLHGLFALNMSAIVRCDHCRLYFLSGSEQKALADDYVSPTPLFPVPLEMMLPAVCCACGKPATKVKEFHHKTEGRVSHASPMVSKLEVKAPMPYCDEHTDGVEFGSMDFTPSTPLFEGFGGPEKNQLVLKVRSYRFYRAAWGL